MKKILMAFIAVLILDGCVGDSSQKQNPEVFGSVMHNAFEGKYSKAQFDSICKKDSLPYDLSKWKINRFVDYETEGALVEFLYIKSLGNNEKIYRLERINNDSFKITKRITE